MIKKQDRSPLFPLFFRKDNPELLRLININPKPKKVKS